MTNEQISRFIFLKYEILKNKYIYYQAPVISGKQLEPVNDTVYDAWEDEYKKLYDELDMKRFNEPRVCDMVGFSTDCREGRFAKMMVDVANMSERDYTNAKMMAKHLHGYDLSLWRK